MTVQAPQVQQVWTPPQQQQVWTPPPQQFWTPPQPTRPQLQQFETLSLLIHAPSKTGKSTLAATAPKPTLVLDAEGSWKFMPLRKIYWDPAQPPPVYDGTWDVCVVIAHHWEAVDLVYRWLTQYPLPFVSFVLDSTTELQRRLKRNLRGTEEMKIQTWGSLLDVMSEHIRDIRDLTLVPWSPIQCVVVVAETELGKSGKWVASMQGKIVNALPYWFDVVGYLYPFWEQDANGQATRECRKLWIAQHPQYDTGERVQGRLGREVTVCPRVDANGVLSGIGTDIEDWMYRIYQPQLTQGGQR
jgi:AAA domain